MIADNMGKKMKDLMDTIGLESDEAEKVKLPEAISFQKKWNANEASEYRFPIFSMMNHSLRATFCTYTWTRKKYETVMQPVYYYLYYLLLLLLLCRWQWTHRHQPMAHEFYSFID